MEGDFTLLGPIDLLQLLASSRKTGAFQVQGTGGQGACFLDRGRPVHAVWGEKTGREALFSLLTQREGRFRFVEGRTAPVASLSESLDNYLLEAIRWLDERVQVGPFDQVQLADASRASHLTLSAEELAVLPHLRRPVAVVDLAFSVNLGLDRVVATLGHLARLGLVRVTPRTPRTARLVVALSPQAGRAVWVDPLLLRAWRGHYGAFERVQVRWGERTVALPVAEAEGAGAKLLVPGEAMLFYGLRAGELVLVWPEV